MMNTIHTKRWLAVVLCAIITIPILLASCIVAGHGVVTAVESHYVASRKNVLSVSGKTANHPEYGTFIIDDPPVFNKTYAGEDSATLVFTNDGTVTIATITPNDNQPQEYEFLDWGAPRQAHIYGLYWTIKNPSSSK